MNAVAYESNKESAGRWVVVRGIQRWVGPFVEPANYELEKYRDQPIPKVDESLTCGPRRGTVAGVKRHYRAKEKQCADCGAAQKKARAESYERNKHKCLDCTMFIDPKAKRCPSCEYARRGRSSANVRLCADCGKTIRDAGTCPHCLEWAERVAAKASWQTVNRESEAA